MVIGTGFYPAVGIHFNFLLPDEVPRGDGEPEACVQLYPLQEAILRLAQRRGHAAPPDFGPHGLGDPQACDRIRGQGHQGVRSGACFTHCFEVGLSSYC